MVLPSARRFTELGIQPKSEIPVTTAIETALRAPQHQADDQTPPDPEQQAREQQS